MGKKWQAYYIAPLQPPTLATFRSWGSSAGAGRVRPAAANIGRIYFRRSFIRTNCENLKNNLPVFPQALFLPHVNEICYTYTCRAHSLKEVSH